MDKIKGMRLLTKTTLLYLLLAVVMFSIGGLISFEQFKKAVSTETDYELIGAFLRTKRAIGNGKLDAIVTSKSLKIDSLSSRVEYDTTKAYTLRDSSIYLKRTQRVETFRKLIGYLSYDEQDYRVEIIDIIFEDADVKSVVSNITIRLFIFLTIGMLLGSVLISKFTFQPFEQILAAIENFQLNSTEPFDNPPTNTKELQQLNRFLKRMTTKARMDYVALKEFSENASHEIQTPIAIAKGKLELLSGSEDLNQEQITLIFSAQRSLTKLSKLGQALALITKIENHEFNAQKAIDFSDIVNNATNNFRELVALKNISLTNQIDDHVSLNIDSTLADILISNLLKNAVQHNIEHGQIEVELNNHLLTVKNTGTPLKQKPETFFKRFKKSSQTSGTLGLGLAIVKKICDLNNLLIQYTYLDNWHVISIKLNSNGD